MQAWLKGPWARPSALHADLSSGLNLVERLFAEITDTATRRDAFKHVRALQAAIKACLAVRNPDPRPDTWMAIERILAKVGRAQSALNAVKDSSVPAHERPLASDRLYAADGIVVNLMRDEPSGRPDAHGSSIKGWTLSLGEA